MSLSDWLRRWPLLLMGLGVIVLALSLFREADDRDLALALLLGVGSVLTGAGIVTVVVGLRDDEPKNE